LANALKNINNAREELLEHFGEYFQPKPNDFLHNWLKCGLGFSAGRRIQAEIWEMNDRSRQKQLRFNVAWKLRHIFFSFNLSINVIAVLWECFYAVIMGAPIKDEFFATATCIWNNTACLHYLEEEDEGGKFNEVIKLKSKYGFCRYYYISSDDMKIFKCNRHALIKSTFEGCDNEDWASADFVLPTCHLITATVNMISSSNTDLNARALINLLGLEAAAYLGGGTTDNAPSALKETLDTFDKIMAECRKSDDNASGS